MKPRNFLIESTIDGRTTPLKGGPKDPGGGFEMFLFMLSNGHHVDQVKITGVVNKYNKLELEITCTGQFDDCITEDDDCNKMLQVKYTTNK